MRLIGSEFAPEVYDVFEDTDHWVLVMQAPTLTCRSCDGLRAGSRRAFLLGERSGVAQGTVMERSGDAPTRHIPVTVPPWQAADAHSELSNVCSRQKKRAGLEARHHAQRLLSCVRALHDLNLVHTDLKTKHFLRFDGEWKCIDFDSVISEGTQALHPHAMLHPLRSRLISRPCVVWVSERPANHSLTAFPDWTHSPTLSTPCCLHTVNAGDPLLHRALRRARSRARPAGLRARPRDQSDRRVGDGIVTAVGFEPPGAF